MDNRLLRTSLSQKLSRFKNLRYLGKSLRHNVNLDIPDDHLMEVRRVIEENRLAKSQTEGSLLQMITSLTIKSDQGPLNTANIDKIPTCLC